MEVSPTIATIQKSPTPRHGKKQALSMTASMPKQNLTTIPTDNKLFGIQEYGFMLAFCIGMCGILLTLRNKKIIISSPASFKEILKGKWKGKEIKSEVGIGVFAKAAILIFLICILLILYCTLHIYGLQPFGETRDMDKLNWFISFLVFYGTVFGAIDITRFLIVNK